MTIGTAERDARVAERSGVLSHARRFCAGVEQARTRHVLTDDEAALIKRAINTFAGDVAIGLHVADDDAALRAAMKIVVGEAS